MCNDNNINRFVCPIICFALMLPGPFFITWFLLQKEYFGFAQTMFYVWCLIDLTIICCIITTLFQRVRTNIGKKTNITITSIDDKV